MPPESPPIRLVRMKYTGISARRASRRRTRTGPGGCPVTSDVADRLIRLPLYAGLTPDEVGRVVEAVRSYRPEDARPPQEAAV